MGFNCLNDMLVQCYVQILNGTFKTLYVFMMDDCNNRTVKLNIRVMLMDMIWIVDFI